MSKLIEHNFKKPRKTIYISGSGKVYFLVSIHKNKEVAKNKAIMYREKTGQLAQVKKGCREYFVVVGKK